MKSLKLKLASAAVALALAAPAQAALTGANTATGGSLFLTVWNGTASYVRNLGILLQDVLNSAPDAATGPNSAWVAETGFTFTNAGDALFTQMFGGSLTGAQWNIVASEAVSTAGKHFVATFDVAAPAFNTTALNNAADRIGNFGGTQNTDTLNWVSGSCNAQNSCATTDNGGVQSGNNPSVWGPTLNVAGMVDTAADGAEAIDFWFAHHGASALAAANLFQFKNSMNEGQWTLAADGTATYALAAAVAPIPLPGAVWLFASGLLGFGAVARRRKQQA